MQAKMSGGEPTQEKNVMFFDVVWASLKSAPFEKPAKAGFFHFVRTRSDQEALSLVLHLQLLSYFF